MRPRSIGSPFSVILQGLIRLFSTIGVAQVPAVRGAGHPGAVGVPVQEVEGRRLVAEQVVVDHVAPDQVVRPQQVEHVGHLAAVEIAALHHLLLDEVDGRLVHEHGRVADPGEILHGHHEAGRIEPLVALGRRAWPSVSVSEVPPMQ